MNFQFRFNRREIYIYFLVSFSYFIITVLLSDSEYMLPNFLMSILLFVGFSFIYDTSKSLFTIKNAYFVIFFVIGIYFRYFLILQDNKIFMNFVLNPRQDTPSFHTKTILTIMLFTVFFIIGYSKSIKRKDTVKLSDDYSTNSVVLFVYVFFTLLYTGYQFTHIRSAVVFDYGVYDNIFNNIGYFNKFVSYIFLISYTEKRNKRDLLYYLLFTIPFIVVSIISLYKGTLIFELLMFIVIIGRKHMKFKKKYVFLLILSFLVIFPTISMLRTNADNPGTYEFNINEVIKYLQDNDPIKYLSYRFQYYDETYYTINTPVSEMESFRDKLENPITLFLTGIIPRALWQEKPVNSTTFLITYDLCQYPIFYITNVSIGEIAESFIYGSYFMIIIVALFHGFMFRMIESFIEKNNSWIAFSIYVLIGRVLIEFMEGVIVGKLIVLLSMYIIIVAFKTLQSIKVR